MDAADMETESFPPPNPIIEAVVDIECDLPPDFDLDALGKAADDCFAPEYPKRENRMVDRFRLGLGSGSSKTQRIEHSTGSLLYRNEVGDQLVQVRGQGYSFNRLAPYSSLDDYLGEIERTWKLYVDLAKPVRIKRTALRYINRIPLPSRGKPVQLDEYFQVEPRLPIGEDLDLTGFLNQHSAVERKSGHQINLVLKGLPREGTVCPILFDIRVHSDDGCQPEDWSGLLAQIQSLRDLKNRIFKNTLTKKCRAMYKDLAE